MKYTISLIKNIFIFFSLILIISCSPQVNEITDKELSEFDYLELGGMKNREVLWIDNIGNSLSSIYVDQGAFKGYLDYVYIKKENGHSKYYRIKTEGYKIKNSNDSSLVLINNSGEEYRINLKEVN